MNGREGVAVEFFGDCRKSVRKLKALDARLDDMSDNGYMHAIGYDGSIVMEPFVRPVLQQVEISLDYLQNRHNLRIGTVFIMGMPSGARYWSQMAEESLRMPLISPSVFEGLSLPPKDHELAELTPSKSQAFLAALGAARAAMEEQA